MLSSDYIWGAIMAWCMFLWEHVSFSKSRLLIFDSFPSMQTVSLSPALIQAIISAVTRAEMQSDLKSFQKCNLSWDSYERAY